MTAPGNLQARRAVVRDCLGVGVAVGAYGVSFGAIAVASGLSPVQTCLLSALAFTGGSQFAFVGVLDGGGSAYSGTATALLLGTRNGLYGVRLASILGLSGARRLLGAHLVIDETAAMSLAHEREGFGRLAFWLTGAAVWTCWNLFTVLGALAGGLLDDPAVLGLDAAVPAAFLALIAPRLTTRLPRMVAIVAAVVAIATTPLLPPGLPVLVAAGVALLVAAGVSS